VLGPVAATFADFWEMVWQQNSNRIAMVTNLEEDGRVILTGHMSMCLTFCRARTCTLSEQSDANGILLLLR